MAISTIAYIRYTMLFNMYFIILLIILLLLLIMYNMCLLFYSSYILYNIYKYQQSYVKSNAHRCSV